MEVILDFSREFDVNLLDQVVNAFFTTGPDEHPDSWTRVDTILTNSSSLQAKFIALQILEKLIQTRWKVLPVDQRQGIRNFIVGTIVSVSSDPQSLHKQRAFINKLNLTLVQILKKEWPHNWPTFITEMVTSSRSNVSICENNMAILKLFSEEIFEYGAEQMTFARTHDMKGHMWQEISEIFNLMKEVLQMASQPSLIAATLNAFLRYLYWLPYGYTFETNIIDIICNRFLDTKEFRNLALKCLTEIGSTNITLPEHLDKSAQMFEMAMRSIYPAISSAPDLNQIYEEGSDEEQEFILNVVLFLTSSLTSRLNYYEKKVSRETVVRAHQCLLHLSRVEEREVFKVCLEYWIFLVKQLYDESNMTPLGGVPLLNMTSMSDQNGASARKKMYAEVLSPLRAVMIEHMVRPEEVLIVENDEGEIVREFVKETDTITLYKSMRECLVYLTHLDVLDTEAIMNEKLARQMDGSEWSWNNLNKLCWAIGSISGAMSEDMEKRFLVIVIKDLLGLCEMKRGKDNKAVVASNIMYVVGQYPRFLKAHWKFLKTVANKLFEFMHESHEGVQDMACDTFIKISNKCKRHFVAQQPGEVAPFIEEIISSMDTITSDLAPQQTHTFYEAVGQMISAQTNASVQEQLVVNYMKLPNQAWFSIIEAVKKDITVLNNPNNIKVLANVLKTNVAACRAVGPGFLSQIGRIYVDMLSLYSNVSAAISREVDEKGMVATKMPHIRAMRTIKKETLKLVQTYVDRADDLYPIRQNMLPMFFDAVLCDYRTNTPAARDAEVLTTLTAIVTRLGSMVTDKVPVILENVFECTVNMINKDFAEFPEHRVGFFNLLRAIDLHCFSALLNLPPAQFQMVLNSIVWAFKHTMRDIADTGLHICVELLNNVGSTEPAVRNAFGQTYFVGLVQDVFFVLTDSDHKNGFRSQCMILSRVFHMVESGLISQPIYDPSKVPPQLGPNPSNTDFLRAYIVNLLANAFPHLHRSQLEQFAVGLFEYTQDFDKFITHVRDFLIQMKEFSGDEVANGTKNGAGGGKSNMVDQLSLIDQEKELERKRQEDMERALKVPGMVKPHDLPTMDDD
ncbi:CRM1 C terminal-domain-containing protein [Dimargaris cristalligena]|uniref:CRM1 C terminal-domain-containing protein n=1 Tax=Dimargaris cristalligena TaxID=215637 RepID=A0A4P9ZP85_9FUNG|nr:CRM1 C terminal-domain-containing protein [Dimargaris cristalligena]|eukprot:RKP35256.1 CRM1 C terminal-domain-containing protein [Dimargaris cristalligena]